MLSSNFCSQAQIGPFVGRRFWMEFSAPTSNWTLHASVTARGYSNQKDAGMNDVVELDYQYDFFPEPDPFMAVDLRQHDGKDLRPTVRGVMRGARADSYPNFRLEEQRNERREIDRRILFILMREMLNRIGDHEIGRGNNEPAMIEVYRQHLHEIVAGGVHAGETAQPTRPEEADVVQALHTVEDVVEAAHLGGLITQEWSETSEFGDAHSAVAFDLGDIAESVSATYGMSVEDVGADFFDWLGMHGPDMVADLVGAWLRDLAGRGRPGSPRLPAGGGPLSRTRFNL
jgi:hypothetical protein